MTGARWQVWVFALGVGVVFGALGWVTHHALRLERAEAGARAQAAHQELVRLALWRMDAAVTPILARESARPYFHYQAFYPAGRAYTRMWRRVEPGDVLVPSPLLSTDDPAVRLYFQRGTDGVLSSPQVPPLEVRPLAQSLYVSSYSLALAEQRLGELRSMLGRRADQADDVAARGWTAPAQELDQAQRLIMDAAEAEPQAAGQLRQQIEISKNEYENRQRAASRANVQAQVARAPPESAAVPAVTSEAQRPLAAAPGGEIPPAWDKSTTAADLKAAQTAGRNSVNLVVGGDTAKRIEPDAAFLGLELKSPAEQGVGGPEPVVAPEPFRADWMRADDGSIQLLLTRRVDVQADGTPMELTQGVWLDWGQLREGLLAEARAVLPGASLRPLTGDTANAPPAVLGRSLAAIPAELVVPPPPPARVPVWSPLRGTLLTAWGVAIAAVATLALVMRASMELAERRGRFVSAVTHELRTPLTTFCLYSQMLADGMVTDEESRRTYVGTLKQEATRLAGIVESVLDYARLGRPGRSGARDVTPTELGERLDAVLRQRCEQAGMVFSLDIRGEASRPAWVDPQRVERIVFNLVDNACKYAIGADDKRVEVVIDAGRDALAITVRDHGPGIARDERRRVFRPFFRGRRQADGSVPGLGLGLALAGGLAREMGGELRLGAGAGGAQLTLKLPWRGA